MTHYPLVFFSTLFVLLLAETFFQRRTPAPAQTLRWSQNTLLGIANAVLGRLAMPVASVVIAAGCASQNWGVLNAVALPQWAGILAAWFMLDLASYFKHRLFHSVPLLWALHRTHHSDWDMDVSSHFRHHPLELAASLAMQTLVLAATGASPAAVLLHEAGHNLCGLFNHANLRLGRLDRVIRLVLVTPDMHRIHHSSWQPETDSNFGGALALWDRVFGTFRVAPRHGHLRMRLGVDALSSGPAGAWKSLLLLRPYPRGRRCPQRIAPGRRD